MLKITSKQNAQLKQWKKLLSSKGRRKAKQYIVEGFHLVEEAIKSQVKINYLMMLEKQYEKHEALFNSVSTNIVIMNEQCLRELSQTETSQGILAIIALPEPVALTETMTRVLLVDAVQDPGNLGTLIRTADAANYDAVILGEGTVDVYNEKVIRSTQGSLWHLPIIQMPLAEAITTLKSQNMSILATALHQNALPYKEIAIPDKLGLVVGNEGNGVSDSVLSLADQTIYIEMPGQAESLNVAIASGILMFNFLK